MQVAYFSGVRDRDDKRGVDYEEVAAQELIKRSIQTGFKGIDLLLTNHWPRGVLNELGFVRPVCLCPSFSRRNFYFVRR
jgi:hypothetical protein